MTNSQLSESPTGDQWIDAYLRFRQAVLDHELETFDDVADYASRLQQDLPAATPSVPAALFIRADIGITFAERSPQLMTALWVPHN